MLNSVLRQVGSFVVALLIVLAVCIGFIPSWTIWDDGLWPVTVTIRSTSGSAIRTASAESLDDPEFVKFYLENLIPPEDRRHSASESPYIGQPLAVNVPTSATTHGALLWSYTRFNQYRKLVVIVEYQDGRKEGRLVDIPDLHKFRTVTVEVP
jgi:hypothetical protein